MPKMRETMRYLNIKLDDIERNESFRLHKIKKHKMKCIEKIKAAKKANVNKEINNSETEETNAIESGIINSSELREIITKKPDDLTFEDIIKKICCIPSRLNGKEMTPSMTSTVTAVMRYLASSSKHKILIPTTVYTTYRLMAETEFHEAIDKTREAVNKYKDINTRVIQEKYYEMLRRRFDIGESYRKGDRHYSLRDKFSAASIKKKGLDDGVQRGKSSKGGKPSDKEIEDGVATSSDVTREELTSKSKMGKEPEPLRPLELAPDMSGSIIEPRDIAKYWAKIRIKRYNWEIIQRGEDEFRRIIEERENDIRLHNKPLTVSPRGSINTYARKLLDNENKYLEEEKRASELQREDLEAERADKEKLEMERTDVPGKEGSEAKTHGNMRDILMDLVECECHKVFGKVIKVSEHFAKMNRKKALEAKVAGLSPEEVCKVVCGPEPGDCTGPPTGTMRFLNTLKDIILNKAPGKRKPLDTDYVCCPEKEMARCECGLVMNKKYMEKITKKLEIAETKTKTNKVDDEGLRKALIKASLESKKAVEPTEEELLETQREKEALLKLKSTGDSTKKILSEHLKEKSFNELDPATVCGESCKFAPKMKNSKNDDLYNKELLYSQLIIDRSSGDINEKQTLANKPQIILNSTETIIKNMEVEIQIKKHEYVSKLDKKTETNTEEIERNEDYIDNQAGAVFNKIVLDSKEATAKENDSIGSNVQSNYLKETNNIERGENYLEGIIEKNSAHSKERQMLCTEPVKILVSAQIIQGNVEKKLQQKPNKIAKTKNSIENQAGDTVVKIPSKCNVITTEEGKTEINLGSESENTNGFSTKPKNSKENYNEHKKEKDKLTEKISSDIKEKSSLATMHVKILASTEMAKVILKKELQTLKVDSVIDEHKKSKKDTSESKSEYGFNDAITPTVNQNVSLKCMSQHTKSNTMAKVASESNENNTSVLNLFKQTACERNCGFNFKPKVSVANNSNKNYESYFAMEHIPISENESQKANQKDRNDVRTLGSKESKDGTTNKAESENSNDIDKTAVGQDVQIMCEKTLIYGPKPDTRGFENNVETCFQMEPKNMLESPDIEYKEAITQDIVNIANKSTSKHSKSFIAKASLIIKKIVSRKEKSIAGFDSILRTICERSCGSDPIHKISTTESKRLSEFERKEAITQEIEKIANITAKAASQIKKVIAGKDSSDVELSIAQSIRSKQSCAFDPVCKAPTTDTSQNNLGIFLMDPKNMVYNEYKDSVRKDNGNAVHESVSKNIVADATTEIALKSKHNVKMDKSIIGFGLPPKNNTMALLKAEPKRLTESKYKNRQKNETVSNESTSKNSIATKKNKTALERKIALTHVDKCVNELDIQTISEISGDIDSQPKRIMLSARKTLKPGLN